MAIELGYREWIINIPQARKSALPLPLMAYDIFFFLSRQWYLEHETLRKKGLI